MRYHSCRLDRTPLSGLYFIGKEVVESLLVSVDSSEDEDCVAQQNRCVSVTRFRSHSFQSADLEPKLRRETVLVDVVHRVVTVPPSNHEHRIVTDNGSMSESIQRLSSSCLDLFPFKLLAFQCAAPEVVEARTPIVAREDVHRSFVKDYCVISSWSRWFTLCHET